MPSKKQEIKTYVTEQEFAQINQSTTQAGLSRSEFLKRCALGTRIDSALDLQAVRDLIRVNADMGRLGGLLKLYLSEEQPDEHQARSLLRDLEDLKKILSKKILDL